MLSEERNSAFISRALFRLEFISKSRRDLDLSRMVNADNDNTTEIKLSREQSSEDSKSIAPSESEEKFGQQAIAL